MCCVLPAGPFCVNGVPLRRVNQAYVIATKTKVDVSKLDVPERINDDYFRRSKQKTKAGSSGIFAESKQVSLDEGTAGVVCGCVCQCMGVWVCVPACVFVYLQSYSVSDVRKEDQRAVDKQLMPLVRAQPSLRQYLADRFSLSHGQYPHQMVF